MTDLRFIGDWKLWAGLLTGLLLAGAAWRLYWRETRRRGGPLRWLLPTLRALAVFLIVMMLTGPVLHHRQVIGELARVLLFVDASESMAITDEQMELPRKLLIAQQLGWVPADKFDTELKLAADSLARAQELALTIKAEMPVAEFKAALGKFSREIGSANDHLGRLRADSWANARPQLPRLREELLAPAQKISLESGGEVAKTMRALTDLVNVAARWEKELRNAFSDHVFRLASVKDGTTQAALERFNTMPRWQRLEALLTSGDDSLLAQFAARHNVELSALVGRKSEVIWWPGGGVGKLDPLRKTPASLPLSPTNRTTDLADPLKARIEELKESERTAVVVFTDGQHNDGSSPLETAKMLGHRGVPVFTVGLGMQHLPQDLAVLEVKGPEAVFADARVHGEILLKDDMRPGLGFRLRIEHEGVTLWEKSLVTEQKHQRSVGYDFSIKELVERELKRQDKDLKLASLPLSLKVSASVLEGEKDAKNNTGSLRFSAVTQKPKLLLMDGRPRWEFRYLRNVFERDQRWDVNALLAGGGGEQKPWARGTQPGQFPADRETLFSYQLICLGDVAPSQFRPEELELLREFVERRGGGLIFIDGAQEKLSSYAQTALGSLLPVTWQGAWLGDTRMKMKLVAGGNLLTPLMLAGDPVENARVWSALPAPHNAAPALALPGTETLLEVSAGGQTAAALVFRRYGAGRVLYAGFDESWRWRYNVGDLHHQKFWNQIARWIMEAPYPVQDKFVSLDSGPLNYRPGETAEIRARLRDQQGRLLLKADAEAQLFRDGQKVAGIALVPDENQGGTYRGRTPPLTEGGYEIRVRVDGLPESEMKARTEFTVAPAGGGEMARLNCDEELLKQIAADSGGQYFREEEAGALVEKLKPLSQGRVVESETALWQSWWWFAPAVLLLTVEWFLRKRAGML